MADFDSIDVFVESGSDFRLNTGGHNVKIVPLEGPILTPPEADVLSPETLETVVDLVNEQDPGAGPVQLALSDDTVDLSPYEELFDAASEHGVQLELHIAPKSR